MMFAKIDGGPPQAKHHAAVVIHPVQLFSIGNTTRKSFGLS